MFHEDFLNFIRLQHTYPFTNQYKVKGFLIHSRSEERLERMKGFVEEIAPRVYAFNLFSMDYCRYEKEGREERRGEERRGEERRGEERRGEERRGEERRGEERRGEERRGEERREERRGEGQRSSYKMK